MENAKISIGSISHGTLQAEDLIAAMYTEAMRILPKDNYQLRNQVNEIIAELYLGEIEEVDAQMMLEDFLSTEAPPFVFFGSHPGDGSDIGYWPDFDALDDAVHAREVLKVDDLSSVPPEYTGQVMIVNDHGNVTLGNMYDGRFTEIWSCV